MVSMLVFHVLCHTCLNFTIRAGRLCSSLFFPCGFTFGRDRHWMLSRSNSTAVLLTADHTEAVYHGSDNNRNPHRHEDKQRRNKAMEEESRVHTTDWFRGDLNCISLLLLWAMWDRWTMDELMRNQGTSLCVPQKHGYMKIRDTVATIHSY